VDKYTFVLSDHPELIAMNLVFISGMLGTLLGWMKCHNKFPARMFELFNPFFILRIYKEFFFQGSGLLYFAAWALITYFVGKIVQGFY